MNDPLAYFLTWHPYGTWLPGHAHGSVDADHRGFGSPLAPPDAERLARSANAMMHDAVVLDVRHREVVQATVIEVCTYRNWVLRALHVRTTHVHAVVTAPVPPEKVLSDFKAYATRRLRSDGLAGNTDRIWSTHGSTLYVWKEQQLAEVSAYVIERQGELLLPAPIDNRAEPGA
jgi:hypothetical protein